MTLKNGRQCLRQTTPHWFHKDRLRDNHLRENRRNDLNEGNRPDWLSALRIDRQQVPKWWEYRSLDPEQGLEMLTLALQSFEITPPPVFHLICTLSYRKSTLLHDSGRARPNISIETILTSKPGLGRCPHILYSRSNTDHSAIITSEL